MIDLKSFIISLKCSWMKRLTKSHKPWMYILSTVNGHDFLQKLYDFGDTFILECLQKENNAFWKDVFNSWLTWYEKGIKVLQDFFFMKTVIFQCLKHLNAKTTSGIYVHCIMQYNSITTAILKYLRCLHIDRTYENYFLILVYLFFFSRYLTF